MIAEADNIRAAWGWGVQRADPRCWSRSWRAFSTSSIFQGRYEEVHRADRPGDPGVAGRRTRHDEPARRRGLGRLLALHAAFQFRRRRVRRARQRAEEALALLEPFRPHRDVGHARLYMGAAWYGLGDLGQAVDWFLAAAAAYEEAGHAWGIGAALDNAGYLEFLRGNAVAAEGQMKRGWPSPCRPAAAIC